MKRINEAALILIAAVLLCWLGFYNNFPFVFYDTGGYLYSGFSNTVPHDRPIFYGLILRHISLADSLWLVILFQGLIVSLSVYFYFVIFVSKEIRKYFFLLYICLVTFFTGASVHVSQLIPDVFAAVTILNFGLLFLADKLKIRSLIIISVMFFLGISVHNSHLTISLVLVLLITILFLFRKVRLKMDFLSPMRLGYIWILLISSYLIISATHLSFGGKFTMAQGKEVFMMSRLSDMEILQKYLDEKCPEHSYKICQYKDSIPWDFIWDQKKSPLYKTGGWESNRKEYKAILFDCLTTPKYLLLYLSRSFECSFKLFFNFDSGDIPQQNEGTGTFYAVQCDFPMKVREYFTSKQASGMISFDKINEAQRIFIGISIFVTLALLFTKISIKYKWILGFFLASLWINALICGSLSGIYSRYQSRVVWLLPLPLILMLASSETVKRKMLTLIQRIEKIHL